MGDLDDSGGSGGSGRADAQLDTEPGASAYRVQGPSWTSASVVALVAANVVPLLGVLWLGWDLDLIMVLFWAENGIIGFFSLLRLIRVAGWGAILLGPFFLVHFGGFMAGHFIFIYALFIREGAEFPMGSAVDALGGLLAPLVPALAALVISHGVSFVTNFLRGRELEGRSASSQMTEPYRRVVILHLTIIFGGWMILNLGAPLWALVLLVVLKSGTDLWAHRREHARSRSPGRPQQGPTVSRRAVSES